ncbi:hypothetical protein JZO81_03915 [Enterococcus hulanensis]|uniref:hypothetical protein n=1 Tax=Enterococcus hulanensis TaxID=2559929 RepID=UPI001A92787C|nr:hypothetical protein [Enterococcus hulanensis]MBO0410184.1 hypothetical protein [Enterococcus hulanensis]
MDKKIIKYLGNPLITQVLIEFENCNMSVKELRLRLPDVPQATLYRYVKKLYQEDILKIVDEKQNRGSVEKIYSLNVELKKNDVEELNTITPKSYYEMFSEFTLGLLAEFSDYSKNEDANVLKDGSGFSLVPIYATAEELVEYGKSISKILEPALIRKSENQDRHNIAIVVTPPRKDN